ncbi:hypothetical protein PFNF135_05509, partial [Plasmodium falciparum NF135/5.C10]
MALGRPGGGEEDIDHQSAKHLLDSIGEKVYKEKVEKEAKTYKDDLKGNLNTANGYSLETLGTNETCKLVEEYRNNTDANSNRYPCTELSGNVGENRFSDTLGGQCTNEKMRSGGKGACAPYRRLHLCDYNLESIETTSTTTHKLLAEVCYAAKYEGESLKNYHAQHQVTYSDSAAELCTVLARSFADIGDIIRGRDLFYGNKQEKEQRDKLDDKLKKIFQKIHDKLGDSIKSNYNDTTDFLKLREDWWTANRHTVWEALTCEVGSGTYFRHTCNGGNITYNKCRCDGKNADQVPTYFDYVPQYLRWFEEWAEDFCRLRKRKLEDAIDKCRKPNGVEKYCDLNRYDCTQTASGKHVFVEDFDCKDCQYSCAHFVKWIDNQKLEFLKQREKYKSEIKKYTNGTTNSKRKKRSASNNYGGYEKHFYEQLKAGGYNGVNSFLDLLNKETTCKKINDEEEGKIDFKNVKSSSASGDGSNKTFYRTTYCEACPWCGAEKESRGKGWKAKEENCSQTKKYDPKNITEIPILYPDKTKGDMVRKYKKFCANDEKSATPTANVGEKGKNGDQIKKWICYYDENKNNNDSSGAINFCVLQDGKQDTKEQKVTSYNAFFWDWVHDMLHDSLEWRERLNSCINNAKSQNCKNNKCNSDCDCFQRWVKQKKDEWKKIKEHFDKQKDIPDGCYFTTLEFLFMNDELLKNIKDTHANADDIKRIGKMLQQAGVASGVAAGSDKCIQGPVAEQDTTIDKFLEEEQQKADECLQTHTNPCPQPPAEDPGVARSDTSHDGAQPRPASEEEDDEEDDDFPDEEIEEEDLGEEETEEDQDGQGPPKVEVEKVCQIVNDVLTGDNTALQDACNQKYSEPNRYWGWKCIPSGGGVPTTGSESEPKRQRREAPSSPSGSSEKGSICVPPRRRKLYVGKLHDWAEKQVETQAGEAAQGDGVSTETPESSLLHAFVKSAAVETFFAWHEYKQEKKKPQGDGSPLLGGGTLGDSDEQNPQTQLQSGTIPNDFLRLMFYTLGDYRDLCVGNVPSGIDTNGKETDMQKIKENIEKVFATSGEQTRDKPGQDPKAWWGDNAKHIWHGMICALTYRDSGEKGEPPEHLEDVEKAFFGTPNDKPGTTGKYKEKYDYNSVKLDNSETQAKSTSPIPSGENTPLNNPKLTEFVEIPTYFRWLHEWGSDFCGTRKHLLDKIIFECRNSDRGGHYYCSGDGYDCEKIKPDKYKTFPQLDCKDCYEQCRNYKIWIQKKRTEFEEQQKKYEGERQKVITTYNDNRDKEFYQNLNKNYTSVDKFLESLNHCKNGQVNNDKNKKIDFKNPENTFNPSTYCKACPIYGVNCNANKRGRSGNNACSENELPNATNTVDGQPTTIPILINDGATDGSTDGTTDGSTDVTDKQLEEKCKDYGLYKNLRKQVWKCQKMSDEVHECSLNNADKSAKFFDSTYYDEKIPFIILFERWLIDFIQYYNKSKKQINLCTKDGEKQCIQGCEGKCECVGKWLKNKSTEWEIIKKYYKTNLETTDELIPSRVKSFFEQGPFNTYADEAKKVVQTTCEKQQLWGCTGDNLKEGEDPENCEKGDFITNLISELEKKIGECASQHSGEETETACQNPSTLPDDEDLLLEEDEQNTVGKEKMGNKAPAFCEIEETKKENDETEGTCEPAQTAPSEETNSDQTPVLKPEDEATAPEAPAPKEDKKVEPPIKLLDNPHVLTALVTSTLAWSVGIGFAAFTYFYLK